MWLNDKKRDFWESFLKQFTIVLVFSVHSINSIDLKNSIILEAKKKQLNNNNNNNRNDKEYIQN